MDCQSSFTFEKVVNAAADNVEDKQYAKQSAIILIILVNKHYVYWLSIFARIALF
jgi:hypothetical protein